MLNFMLVFLSWVYKITIYKVGAFGCWQRLLSNSTSECETKMAGLIPLTTSESIITFATLDFGISNITGTRTFSKIDLNPRAPVPFLCALSTISFKESSVKVSDT